MTQPHNPPSECPRLGGADPAHKALRTVHGTAVSGMWVNGTCPCDPNKIQKPELAPSSGYCNGYAHLNYNPLFPQSGIDTNAYQTIHERVTGTGPVDPLVQRIAMVKRKSDNAEVNRMMF